MKTTPDTATSTPDFSSFSAAEMVAVITDLQQQLASKEEAIQRRDARIEILEELLRHKKIQQFAASSEKSACQFHLFDEAELEVEIDALRDQLPDDVAEEDAPRSSRKRRQRGFSDTLLRERIELPLSDEEKAGATKTFFTKVKEELEFIPAQLKVLEYWQEKAVFEQDGEERVVALSHLRKLYRIEKAARDLSDTERYRVRQEKSLPLLATFKAWLEANVSKVLKGSLTRKAMDYTLNQWDYLIGGNRQGQPVGALSLHPPPAPAYC